MLKLNVGLSRKVGEANYGSRGASVNLELEMETSLATDPDALRDRVRQLFRMARASVDEELNGNGQASNGNEPANGESRQHGDGHSESNGNGHRASDKQLSYARQLAGQITGLGARRLESICQTMFRRPLADLTTVDASGLIDTLKEIKAGNIDLAGVTNGAAL
jgi:hypothetical protein